MALSGHARAAPAAGATAGGRFRGNGQMAPTPSAAHFPSTRRCGGGCGGTGGAHRLSSATGARRGHPAGQRSGAPWRENRARKPRAAATRRRSPHPPPSPPVDDDKPGQSRGVPLGCGESGCGWGGGGWQLWLGRRGWRLWLGGRGGGLWSWWGGGGGRGHACGGWRSGRNGGRSGAAGGDAACPRLLPYKGGGGGCRGGAGGVLGGEGVIGVGGGERVQGARHGSIAFSSRLFTSLSFFIAFVEEDLFVCQSVVTGSGSGAIVTVGASVAVVQGRAHARCRKRLEREPDGVASLMPAWAGCGRRVPRWGQGRPHLRHPAPPPSWRCHRGARAAVARRMLPMAVSARCASAAADVLGDRTAAAAATGGYGAAGLAAGTEPASVGSLVGGGGAGGGRGGAGLWFGGGGEPSLLAPLRRRQDGHRLAQRRGGSGRRR